MSERNVGNNVHEASVQGTERESAYEQTESRFKTAAEAALMRKLEMEGKPVTSDQLSEMLKKDAALAGKARDLHLELKGAFIEADKQGLSGDGRRQFLDASIRGTLQEFFDGKKEQELQKKRAPGTEGLPTTAELKSRLKGNGPIADDIEQRARNSVMGGHHKSHPADRVGGKNEKDKPKKHILKRFVGAVAIAATAAGFGYAGYSLFAKPKPETSYTLDISKENKNNQEIKAATGDIIPGSDWYSAKDDAFNRDGKHQEEDWAPPLGGETAQESGEAFLDNLKTSPGQLATVVERTGHMAGDTDRVTLQQNIESSRATAEENFDNIMKGGVEFTYYRDLNPGDVYSSYYAVGHENGVLVSYDEYVTASTSSKVIMMKYKDAAGQPGSLLIREQCGQIIDIFEEAVETPQGGGEVVVNTPAPQGGGEVVVNAPAPQGGGEVTKPVPQGGGGELEKPDPKPEPKPEPKPDPKPEPGPEPKPNPGPEPSPEPSPEPEPKKEEKKDYTLVPEQAGWDQQAAGDLTEDPAKVGNGTTSPDMTAEQQPGQAIDAAQNVTTDTTGGEAASVIGTGEGRTAATGDHGETAAAADAAQGSNDAVGEATTAHTEQVDDAVTAEDPGTSAETTL